MLTGCDTALPVDGDRMSSPPPISVMSCTGVQGLTPCSCIASADSNQRQPRFCQESHTVKAQAEDQGTEQSDAARRFVRSPCSGICGRTWLSFSRMAEKRGVRVPDTTLSGSLYPHLARTWSASECTSATSCSACMQTPTQAQHNNRQPKALLQVIHLPQRTLAARVVWVILKAGCRLCWCVSILSMEESNLSTRCKERSAKGPC